MKNIPTYSIVFVSLFVVACGLGGFFWYWAGDQYQTAVQERDGVVTKLSSIDRRPILPVKKNLDAIIGIKDGFTELLAAEMPLVRIGDGAFSSVVSEWKDGRPSGGLAPDEWKRLMNEKRQALDKLAEENRVAIPKDFYYGFARYRVPNPEPGITAGLGIQLLGINQLFEILIKNRVPSIRSVRRVFFEDAGRPAGQPQTSDEALPGSILPGPMGLYLTYPFEVTFQSTAAELSKILNQIATAPLLFVVRSVTVENEVTEVKRRSAILGQVTEKAKQTGKLFVTVAGEEFLTVRLRLDLIVWCPKGETNEPATGAAESPAPAPRGNRP